MGNIFSGNLDEEKKKKPEQRGWIMGHFVDPNSVFHNKDFEIKWSSWNKEQKKEKESMNNNAKTLTILIKGKFLIKFPKDNKEITLSKPGDFAFWDKDIFHISEALEDSIALAIRWPSLPNDQKESD